MVEDIATGLSSLNGLKFSVYPAFARQTRGLVHLKTAGTSYPEALRVAAAQAPGLFHEIYALARRRYETDRASYYVPAETGHAAGDFGDAGLPSLLERFDAREILHVTFGSELNRASYRERLFALLREHPEDYTGALEREAIRKAMRGGRRVNGTLEGLFDLSGRVAVVTGATGTLDGEMARGLARAGARVGSWAAAKSGPRRSSRR